MTSTSNREAATLTNEHKLLWLGKWTLLLLLVVGDSIANGGGAGYTVA